LESVETGAAFTAGSYHFGAFIGRASHGPFWDIVRILPDARSLREVSKDKWGRRRYRGKKPVMDVNHHAQAAMASIATTANASLLTAKSNINFLFLTATARRSSVTHISVAKI